jgi:nucleotide-binding universal stress UspA family protein
VRALLCLDGHGTTELLRRAGRLLDLAGADCVALHVADTAPRGALELARRGFIGAPRLPGDRAAELDAAERARADTVARDAAAELARHGLRAEVVVRPGLPEREIVAYAAAIQADVVVLFAHRFGRPAPAGPKSVGHTARFVLDHAPCPVLLLRDA